MSAQNVIFALGWRTSKVHVEHVRTAAQHNDRQNEYGTMAAHNDLGRWGEQVAADYLAAEGYRIVERDWHIGHRDIDIVAMDCDELVIVEVKTRRANALIAPELAVDRQKIKSLAAAASAFVKQRRLGLPLRFDIIAVTETADGKPEINHIKSAFIPIPY